MATKELRVRVKHAYLSAAEWVSKNPILQAGELGFESDTLKYKIGDGITKWSNLFYAGGIIVDKELSSTSTNPVQNKVIYDALQDKVNAKDIFSGFGLNGLRTKIEWREATQILGSINAFNYTGTAAKATQDGAGNVITETYATKADVSGVVKSVNNINPDENGNVTIDIPTVTIEEMKAMFTVK